MQRKSGAFLPKQVGPVLLNGTRALNPASLNMSPKEHAIAVLELRIGAQHKPANDLCGYPLVRLRTDVPTCCA
jgi:hypothetical protein